MDLEIEKEEAQEFKDELNGKFIPTATYTGKQIAHIINASSIKSIYKRDKPSIICKGDVITVKTAKKVRPAIVIKVLRDRTVIYIHLTSSENIHCMTAGKSRFFGESCFTYGFSICSEEDAIENYIGIYDNMKAVNQAVRDLKEFFTKSL